MKKWYELSSGSKLYGEQHIIEAIARVHGVTVIGECEAPIHDAFTEFYHVEEADIKTAQHFAASKLLEQIQETTLGSKLPEGTYQRMSDIINA